ncbi:hypothetical protein [Paraburkholderia aspalathi]|uniref:hypothetical protein n=1 Tax=Paraburkholderia aspalathi TaxID=1324617 RepID=UPI001BAD7874|nr:hypothetical protein [Paraburkholderia aspalathi]
MILDSQRIQTPNALGVMVVSFNVLCDGIVVDNVSTQAVAFERMDVLWAKRPEADRVAEQLYSGD